MFSSFIARRYFSGRKKMFSSFLSVVAVMGVSLGVFALVVVMSVMLGFARDLEQRLIGFNAHVIVEGGNKEKIIELLGTDVAASAVIVDGEGVIEIAGTNSAQGVKIRGMDTADLDKLRGAEFYPPTSSSTSLIRANERAHEQTSVRVGSELAFQLGIHPELDDKITIVSPIGRVGPAGDLIPEKMTLPVAGIFKTGYFEHDAKTVIISKGSALKLLGGTGSLHIWLKNYRDSQECAQKMRNAFPELNISTWGAANKKLFAALNLERIAMSLLLSLIVVIASISIVSVIFMYVFLRRKDIAILSAIGASKKQVRAIFLKIGSYIGILGTFFGLTFGIFVCSYLKRDPVSLPSSYYLDHLPVIISWPFLAVVVFCGIALSVLAAVYPANQAAELKPQELLRYE